MERPTGKSEVGVLDRAISWAWRALLGLFVITALYQGYAVLPGLHGHSLYSLFQRVLLFAMPPVVAWWIYRGYRQGLGLLGLYCAWGVWLALRYQMTSPHTYYTFYYLWTQVGGLLLLLALWVLARHPAWFRTTVAVALTAFYLATLAVATWEVRTAHHLAASRSLGPPPSHVPTGFFFDPNNLGVAMALLIPFMAALPVWYRRPWMRIASAALVLYGLWVLFETGSRGGELELVIAAVAGIASLPPHHRRRWGAVALLTLLALALVVFGLNRLPASHLPFALQKLRDLVHLVWLSSNPSQGPGSVRIRLALIQGGILALLHHPLGLGPRGAEQYFAYWVHHGAPFNTYGVVDAHNMWLEAAIDGGWPGLILWVAAYVLLMRRVASLRRERAPFLRYLYWAGWPGLWGFILGSLSPSSVFLGFQLMWVFLGILIGATVLAQTQHQPLRVRHQLRHLG